VDGHDLQSCSQSTEHLLLVWIGSLNGEVFDVVFTVCPGFMDGNIGPFATWANLPEY
jgi:hypothetical protein